ncbi:Rhamnogalacturonate lyase, partial [Camellia lanceoleosa]
TSSLSTPKNIARRRLSSPRPRGSFTGLLRSPIPSLVFSDTCSMFDLLKIVGENTRKDYSLVVMSERSTEMKFSDNSRMTPFFFFFFFPFILLIYSIGGRGCRGIVWSFAIYQNTISCRDDDGDLRSIVSKDLFHYMAVSDDRQRFMPLPDDRMPGRGKALAYPEAVLLINPVEPELKGQVDEKYQYSCENKDLRVHGWISTDPPAIGFWQITPSDEFRSGGPIKQNLSSHVGPTCLAMFLSSHYAGDDLTPKFGQGEAWKKVFGPVFIYLNSAMDGDDPFTLWEDAKNQMLVEVQSWPYSFPASEDLPSSDQRGSISGRLLVRDRYMSNDYISANGAYVGLAPPGDVGSWQRECKDYQFWTRVDENGYFSINDVRTGDYNLYAFVPGFIGDYRNDVVHFDAHGKTGCDIDIGDLVYEPPRDGPTLWEIGIPDRSAAEFYIPDPDPKYISRLFVDPPNRACLTVLMEILMILNSQVLVNKCGVSSVVQDFDSVNIAVMMDVTSLVSLLLLLQFYYYYFSSVLITGKPDDVCFCLNELDDSPVDAILMLCCS